MNLSFFLTLSGLGVSVAGFAALLSSFRPGELAKVDAWRVRMIVILAFRVAIISLGALAIDALVDNADLAIRLASLLATLMLVHPMWTSGRDSEVYNSRSEFQTSIAYNFVSVVVPVVVNLFLASPGLLMVIYIIILTHPMSIFVAFISEIYVPPAKTE